MINTLKKNFLRVKRKALKMYYGIDSLEELFSRIKLTKSSIQEENSSVSISPHRGGGIILYLR